MRYLVTGAAGFIGSHISRRLLLEGNEVICVDNFNDYYSVELKKLRILKLLRPLGVSVLNIDLAHPREVDVLFNSFKFDSVIHLAAQAGVRLKTKQYSKYSSSNLDAFTNVLIETVNTGVANFIYASSSSVYGNSDRYFFSEDDGHIKPISFYGATKLSNEILTHSAILNSSTRARGLRFFTVYGPWGRPDMAYFRIIANAISNYNFIRFGDGSTTRDFTYIDDVVECVSRLNFELKNRPLGYSDVVNIGGGSPSSLNEMIRLISDLTNTPLPDVSVGMHPHDVNRTQASTQYLSKLIEMPTFHSLRAGLSDVVEWAKTLEVKNQISGWCNSVD